MLYTLDWTAGPPVIWTREQCVVVAALLAFAVCLLLILYKRKRLLSIWYKRKRRRDNLYHPHAFEPVVTTDDINYRCSCGSTLNSGGGARTVFVNAVRALIHLHRSQGHTVRVHDPHDLLNAIVDMTMVS